MFELNEVATSNLAATAPPLAEIVKQIGVAPEIIKPLFVSAVDLLASARSPVSWATRF